MTDRIKRAAETIRTTGRSAAAFLVYASLIGALYPAAGQTNENPYAVIAERNIFRLKPPPPAPVVAEEPVYPAVDIKLSGISSMAATNRVFLVVLESGTTVPKYLNLAEGQQQGEFEVMKVDAESGQVRLRHRTEDVRLTFKTTEIKSAPLAMPAAALVASAGEAVVSPESSAPRRAPVETSPGDGSQAAARPTEKQ